MDSASLKTRSSSRQVEKSWKIRENDELAPVVLEALPPIAKPLVDKEIPLFEPHSRMPFDSMHPGVPVQFPLHLFLLLLGKETLLQILTATNAPAAMVMDNAAGFQNPQPWHPLTRYELIVWLGSLFWMGRHSEHNREYYWNSSISMFGREVMSKTRWEQIHRFMKTNNNERQAGQPWWYKIDPMLT